MSKENQAEKNSRTKAGKKQVLDEASKWERLNAAIARIMKPAGEKA
ncbi:MAG TPA: hypothetical protein VFY40_27795 [Blastocatellia bacterium]|nr:hypothetical protein [Blastocatellia bacterium]